jgi:ABC-type bacteriocin/lantibiotic exporter with double-glycine peptidase domain
VAIAASASAQDLVMLDVPFVSQHKNGCGAASVAMVLQYWQNQRGQSPVVDPAEVYRTIYDNGARGVYASAMETYFRRHGFRTFALRGEWRDLQEHLGKGRPLIVALKTGRDDRHFVVVTGLDHRPDLLLKHDPAAGRKLLKQSRAEFEKQWKAAGNWTLLAVPE